jgi:hypothetical protein
MEIRALKPYLIVIALMVITSLALAFTVDVSVSDEAGIRFVKDSVGESKMYLPDRVGPWEGHEMRYCQTKTCQMSYRVDELTDMTTCPECGGELDMMTLAEKEQLPGDTIFLKKQYLRADGERIFVSAVLSGKERDSIHRPQRCLVGQGNTIEDGDLISVPLENGEKINLMLLEITRNVRTREGLAEHKGYFAYWFIGKDRVTPYHLERMFWMAADRIFRNVAHKWAYIGIQGEQMENDAHIDRIRDFVRDLYPQISLIGEKG